VGDNLQRQLRALVEGKQFEQMTVIELR